MNKWEIANLRTVPEEERPDNWLALFHSELPCEDCKGLCCKSFLVEIPKPTTWGMFDHYAWILDREGVRLLVKDGEWHLQVDTVCGGFDQENGTCGIYEERYPTCRRWPELPGVDSCLAYTERGRKQVYDFVFEAPEDLKSYGELIMKEPWKKYSDLCSKENLTSDTSCGKDSAAEESANLTKEGGVL